MVKKLSEQQKERFWNNVKKTPHCWIWTSYKNEGGYGRFGINYKHEFAHRVSYFLSKGSIPSQMTIDHLCRNRLCVNPSHLEIVSRGENVLRGENFTAKQKRQKKCSSGHIFLRENTYIYGNHRKCKKCNVANAQTFRLNNPDYYKNFYKVS